ncbi:MAG: hypothetical protein JJU45_11795 [Acidimicrobiia bacterium]|nr:hypothetical protein [Acidimicrobiia bacterium]
MRRDNAGDHMVPLPPSGRVFTERHRVRVGDCDPQGSWRFDGLARAVQDLAGDDSADAGVASPGWVVRRTVVQTHQPARFGEELDLSTWCGGLGRRWAERRVQVAGSRGAAIDVAMLWVHVDPSSGRPVPLTDEFRSRFGEAAQGREVTARLRHGDPHDIVGEATDGAEVHAASGGSEGAGSEHGGLVEQRPWPLRATDLDVWGHVNNAASWAAVEELLADRSVAERFEGGAGRSGRRGRAEIEYRAAIDPGDEPTLRWQVAETADERIGVRSLGVWLCVPTAARPHGEVRVSARLTPVVDGDG